jgi:hypothetical protein
MPILAEYAVECSIAKVLASEALGDIADEGVQIHGGYGFMTGYDVERAYRDNRINRIFEGTNEINRLLIPQTIVRRVRRGELPSVDVEAAVAGIVEMTASPPDVPLGGERYLLEVARKLFWVITGLAERRYPAGFDDAQDILAIAADVAIAVFAMESAVVRAASAIEAADPLAALHQDFATAYVQEAATKLAGPLRSAIVHLADAADRPALLALVDRLASSIDTIGVDRRIAEGVVGADGWPLG